MTENPRDGRIERRHPMRRGRRGTPAPRPAEPAAPQFTDPAPGRTSARPDFTRPETYMREQAPSVADPSRAVPGPLPYHDRGPARQRRTGLTFALVFAALAAALYYAYDAYGPVVDGVAGAVAAFAIAFAIHVLRPAPLLRFMLVVIALACLAVTFAMVLHIHLHGQA